MKIGDLDPRAPELRAGSRYNRDAAFMTAAYGAGSDVLAVMVQTPEGQCSQYATLNKIDALEWQLRQIEGVDSSNSLALLNRRLLTLYVYLHDHKADTLARVVGHVEAFARAHDTAEVKFLLASGSAGIEAATNLVVRNSWHQMLLLVYGAVALLCFVTFRSWRAVLVAVLPRVLTSLLAAALMVGQGMGVKVATLPVIALGVGIGVDFALYILSITLAQLRLGQTLSQAYRHALRFTGKVVLLTGVTLATGVVTWVASPIKFQADMGLLLAFMFLWNMLGALVLLPALAFFLLKPAQLQAATPAGTSGLDSPVCEPCSPVAAGLPEMAEASMSKTRTILLLGASQ